MEKLKAHLSNLHYWNQQIGDELPKLADIPAQQRRKLSPLAKVNLDIALKTLASKKVDYIVWVSKFGEESKTIDILQSIGEDFPPSPLQFSSSVHNAVAGLFSILTVNHTPSTSLGIYKDVFVQSFIEALSCIRANLAQTVLVVIADDKLPALLAENYENNNQSFYAFAYLLENNPVANLEIITNVAADSESLTATEDMREIYRFWFSASQKLRIGNYLLVKK